MDRRIEGWIDGFDGNGIGGALALTLGDDVVSNWPISKGIDVGKCAAN